MIGRKKECEELLKIYNRVDASLVAVYGRIRIGKTYLINSVFEGKITFRHAGLSPQDDEDSRKLSKQLNHFYQSLKLYGLKKGDKPQNWFEAFYLLIELLKNNNEKRVVFLDELPWLDTPKSDFIQAFEGFWNTWACAQKNLLVIVCGSAISWMQDKLINNYGGLYGRITHEIKLSPFTLKECAEYYKQKNISFSQYDIVQSYMVFGGIPYYLEYINSNDSLAQNIDNIFFKKNGILKNEYDRLFNSIFTNPDRTKSIVQLLYTNNMGFTKKEIAENLKIGDGGNLTKVLNSLVASDFIIKYVPFGTFKKVEYYKLVDPFCLFYLEFLFNNSISNEKFWQQNVTSNKLNIWRGLAFENVCFNHIEQIKKALDIAGVITTSSAWCLKASEEHEGTQIDLLIIRNDNVVNMCELKFYSSDVVINKAYYLKLMERQTLLSENISKKMSILNTLITTFGIKDNEYKGIFNNVLTIDSLFI